LASLLELQRGFGSALADAAGAARSAALFRGPPERALARLAVYRGNVFGNCSKALAGAYPIVRKIVGEEFFEDLSRAYWRSRPSVSGDLNEYGRGFDAFLAGCAQVQDLPYLPDVAHMEWLAHRAYYAADSARFDPSRLAALPPERHPGLRPVLARACALFESHWPLARIWEVHQDDYTGEINVDLGAGGERILVHRPAWRAVVIGLGAADHALLCAIRDGLALGPALEAALAADPAYGPSAALARWVGAGAIVALAAGEPR
jgi:hypothetical protein